MIKKLLWLVALILATAYFGLAISLAWNWNIFPVTGVLISWQAAFSAVLIVRSMRLRSDASDPDEAKLFVGALAVSTAIILFSYLASLVP